MGRTEVSTSVFFGRHMARTHESAAHVAREWSARPKRSQGTQEIKDILLSAFRQRIEVADYGVGLGSITSGNASTCVGANRLQQIARAPVMQEKEPLSRPP